MTPFANIATNKFSDGSSIGQVKKSDGNSSNYRFFEIQPIKWIVLNYNYLPSKYGTGGNGTHTRLELFANNVLVSGVAPTKTLWKDNTINTYLNNTFYKEAFPKTLLNQSTIYNNTNSSDENIQASGSNSNYLANGSNSTTQMLYLLSYYEIYNLTGPYAGTDKIFRNDTDRLSFGSDYAKAHCLYISPTYSSSDLWSRTTDGTYIYFVSTSGSIATKITSTTYYGTRPAMQRGQECLF